MPESKHILFICSRLDLPGGIERAIVNTANLFFEKGHSVTILVLDDTASTFYPIHTGIHVLQQPLSFGITKDGNIFSRKLKMLSDVLRLRKIFRQVHADLVIATEYPFAAAAILSGVKNKASVLAWEHHHFYELKRNQFWNRIFNYSYPRLDGIVCLNDDEKKIYEKINSSVFVIPNFINSHASRSFLETKTILSVARLTYVKGMDLLAEVAGNVFKKHPDWRWKLIGSGELENEIRKDAGKENLVLNLDVQHPVNHEIMNEYQEASLYVMLSRNECFPMTLLEAQSAGLPCIAFDCDTGPRHIIAKGENGLLVNPGNTAAMADAISMLIMNEELRKEMGNKAVENVRKFTKDKIYEKWQAVISTI